MRESFLAAKPWGPVPEAPRGFSWEGLMELALDMARKGAEQGEVPVGAVICDLQGTILAKAHNLSIQNCDPTAHAEILALRAAGLRRNNYRLSDCVLGVSLVPCFMCWGRSARRALQGLFSVRMIKGRGRFVLVMRD